MKKIRQSPHIGYSSNKKIRFKAASGGALTEICCYLLENKKVDAIIHTTYDPDDQTKTISCVSTTVEEVIHRNIVRAFLSLSSIRTVRPFLSRRSQNIRRVTTV